MSIPPKEYLVAVDRQKNRRFNENEIKSFVYHVFALYDKHEDFDKFLPFLAEHGLEMRFPDIPPIKSHSDFEKWYNGIGADYASNLHFVERMDVKFLENGKYEVDLMVLWQAQPRQGGFEKKQFHQVWTLNDGSQSTWPEILSYIVEEVTRGDIWENYVDYLEGKHADEWCALWSEAGLFVVQYGRGPGGDPEKYGEGQKVDLRNFMFGKIDQIKNIDVENSVIHQTIDPNVFFVTFEFNAETTSGHKYENRIVAQVILDQGKIKELIEYADPRPRELFLKALGV